MTTKHETPTWQEIAEEFNRFIGMRKEDLYQESREWDYAFFGTPNHKAYVSKIITEMATRRFDNELLWQYFTSEHASQEWEEARRLVDDDLEVAHEAFCIWVHVYADMYGHSEITDEVRAAARKFLDTFK